MFGCQVFAFVLAFLTTVLSADENSFSVTPEYAYSNGVGSQVLLNQQSFGNSWNTPSNTPYNPQQTNFDRVVLELRVNSTGANYDRLGQLFIDDIEIWRTSTPEPDDHGTSWTVFKDVSHYSDLFKAQHTINFLIQNRVTNEFTGVFFVTLVAHFYNNAGVVAREDGGWIIDLDNQPSVVKALNKDGKCSSWSAPGDDISVEVGPLDRSVNRAVIHVFASGSGDDEFWWDTTHSSPGPSRFVDVYVGDKLAGFASPYPVIYTGGVNPYLWKPLVDVKAFDIPAYFIDITPFLPTLWDKSTPISIKISNGIDNSQVPSNWIVNYNLLTWSTPGQSNSGSMDSPQYSGPNSNAAQQFNVEIERELTNSATLNIGGQSQSVKWHQESDFNNTALNSGNTIWQTTSGSASISGLYSFSMDFNYPLRCDMEQNFYRVQQTFDVITNHVDYQTWIDSTVQLDSNGDFTSSKSRQYSQGPDGSHYAETQNMELTTQW